MNNKIIVVTALSSLLFLSGCASNDKIIEQQNKQAEQINTIDSKVSKLESVLKIQKNTDEELSQAVNKLHSKQNHLRKQVEIMTKTYSVKQNDTLYNIAKVYGIKLDKLLQLNPQIKKPNRLLIGQMINIK